jgi:hypothetical protein
VTLGSPQVTDEFKRTLALRVVFASTVCRPWRTRIYGVTLRRTATDGPAARPSAGQTAVRVDLANPTAAAVKGTSTLIALRCDQT